MRKQKGSEATAKDALQSSQSDGGLYGTEVSKRRISAELFAQAKMFYTYILRSLSHPDQRYIGSTSDLKARLTKHNEGGVPHTAKFRPWKIESYFAFETKEKAAAFEAYLKSGSGHAFANRHF